MMMDQIPVLQRVCPRKETQWRSCKIFSSFSHTSLSFLQLSRSMKLFHSSRKVTKWQLHHLHIDFKGFKHSKDSFTNLGISSVSNIWLIHHLHFPSQGQFWNIQSPHYSMGSWCCQWKQCNIMIMWWRRHVKAQRLGLLLRILAHRKT